jgi:hypothetical protein
MLMLDQDTTVAPDMVETLIEVVRREPDIQRLALVGSNFKANLGDWNACGAAQKLSRHETVTAITSGGLVSLSAFAIGGLQMIFSSTA